jgi:TolB protein
MSISPSLHRLAHLHFVRSYVHSTRRGFLVVGLLSALVLLAACSAQEPGLVFTSDRDGNRDIYSIDLESGEETNLTFSSRDEYRARLSPDKSAIAFISEQDGRTMIETIQLTGETKDRIRVSQGEGSQRDHHWSPDGSRIAYLTEEDGKSTVFTTELEDNRPARLTSVEADEVGPWSPDGKDLLFTVYSGDAIGIYKRNPDGVNEERLTSENDINPVWSPDSKKIAFISLRDGNPELYVMNADGKEIKRLTNNETRESDIAWSPDGRRIAFVSEFDGNAEIYTVKPDGSDSNRLTANTIRDEQPVWSPDSKRIAFVSHLDDDSEIVVMNVDGTGQQRLTNNDADDFEPDW